MPLSDLFKRLFQKEGSSEPEIENELAQTLNLEIDEEDRVVVAIAASIMAGKDKPDSHFHISKITRVK
jgi:pantothenate kinase